MDVDGTQSSVRARMGETVLSLLAEPLSAPILRAHLDGPLRMPDLRECLGGAPQTTLRGRVGSLRAIGALERHVRQGMPYTVENELTDAGRGILAVADVIEAWLARSPNGPLAFGSEPAKGAIRALVAGWGSTMLSVLAARPLSLTELDGAIPDVSYPSLERRLSAMRAARQIKTMSATDGRAKPYGVTEWTRQAVGPLVAAGYCESTHLPDCAEPLTRTDIEATFLLGVPLITLPRGASGECFLVVTGSGGDEASEHLVEVRVEIEDGSVVSCTPAREAGPDISARGDVEAWAVAVLEGRLDGLCRGGDSPDLAGALVERMHASFRSCQGTTAMSLEN